MRRFWEEICRVTETHEEVEERPKKADLNGGPDRVFDRTYSLNTWVVTILHHTNLYIRAIFPTILGIPVGETNHKTSLWIPIKIYFSWNIFKPTFLSEHIISCSDACV